MCVLYASGAKDQGWEGDLRIRTLSLPRHE